MPTTQKDGYSPISGPLPPGNPPVGAVVCSASVPSPVEGIERNGAASAAWTAYSARRKEQGDKTSARNAKVRALVYATVGQREETVGDFVSLAPYQGRTVKAADGTSSRALPAGAICAYAPLVPRIAGQDEQGQPLNATDERGRWIYDVRSDRAAAAVPLSTVRRIIGRYRIGSAVKLPKLAGYGCFVAVTSSQDDGSVMVGTVIPCASVGRLIADIGVRLAPDKLGALLVPCSSEHVIEWASHVHGDRDPDVTDEAAYEDSIVTVAIGAVVLPPEREARASARAEKRLASGAGTDAAPVLRRYLPVATSTSAAAAAIAAK